MISSVVADVHVRAGQRFENQAVGPAVGVYVLLPRLGWLSRDAAGLRHARPALWRRRSRRRQRRWPAAVPAGAGVARGCGCRSGWPPGSRGVLPGQRCHPSRVSGRAGGVGANAGVGGCAHPDIAAGPRGGWPGLRRASRASIDPDQVAQASKRLALLARSALTGRAFLASFGCAWAGLLFGLLSPDLMFVAVRYQPGFGPLAVACSAANVVRPSRSRPAGWAWPRSR